MWTRIVVGRKTKLCVYSHEVLGLFFIYLFHFYFIFFISFLFIHFICIEIRINFEFEKYEHVDDKNSKETVRKHDMLW